MISRDKKNEKRALHAHPFIEAQTWASGGGGEIRPRLKFLPSQKFGLGTSSQNFLLKIFGSAVRISRKPRFLLFVCKMR